MNKSYILILIFVLLLSNSVQAQIFVQSSSILSYDAATHEGDLGCGNQSTPFPVDWDGDGDLDIISGSTAGVCFFQNQGNDVFALYPGDFGSLGVGAPYVVDWDGDGFYDIFKGYGSQIDYYHNDGNDDDWVGGNTFVETSEFITFTGADAKPTIVDWDGVNGFDLFAAIDTGPIHFFANTGDDINFNSDEDWLSETYGSTVSIYSATFGDINEDGYVDLLAGKSNGTFSYFQNNGAGGFETVVENLNDINLNSNRATPRLVDWDGDGHLDFITGMTHGYIALFLRDFDEDGYVGDDDCNNDDATINNEATEVCDGIDNNCDGTVDEDNTADGTTYYLDTDEDGFGNPDSSIITCDATAPTGYVTNTTDCNDSDATASAVTTLYYDADADGFGDENISVESCNTLTGFVTNSSDCDDTDATINADCPAAGDDDDDDDTTTASSGGCSLQAGDERSFEISSTMVIMSLFLLAKFKFSKLR